MEIYKLIFFLLLVINVQSRDAPCKTQDCMSFLESDTSLPELKLLEGSESHGTSIRCFWMETSQMAVFDLKELKRPLSAEKDYSFNVSDKIVKYNFCADVIDTCKSRSSQVIVSAANTVADCKRYAGPVQNGNNWKLINATNTLEGVEIELNSAEPCKEDPDTHAVLENYTVIYQIKCNPKLEKKFVLLNEQEFKPGECKNTLIFESTESCPKVNFYAIWKFIVDRAPLFGAALILLGLFEVLLGAKLMVITIFIVSCVSTITVVFIFMYQFIIPSGTNPLVIWVVLVICLVCGGVIGYLITKYNRAVIGILLGCYTGYILGQVLYNLGLNRIEASPTIILWATIIVCMVVLVIISIVLFNHILIIATSLCGAYAFIRGISLFAGGFPNEYYIIDLINKGEHDTLKKELTPAVFIYLASWVIVCVFGIIFQYKTKKEESNEKEDGNDTRKFFLGGK